MDTIGYRVEINSIVRARKESGKLRLPLAFSLKLSFYLKLPEGNGLPV